jgi:malate synthase
MPSAPTGRGAAVSGPASATAARVLTPDALRFLATLAREFEPRRQALLARRQAVQARMHAGQRPEFPPHSRVIREGQWAIDPLPADLQDRRVEIIAPPARATLVEALYSGARTCIADFEDSHAPTWEATLQGQVSLMDVVDGSIAATPPEGAPGRLAARPATLCVRPRGWHLDEKHVRLDGRPVAAGLFDFGIYFFHNARGLAAKGSGPYFYLPKLESHHEARLWNDVFVHAQEKLGIPRGSIRATVLIETVLAALEMDEILYELREHASGLNAGRWDYIFSAIKKFRKFDRFILPDRAEVTMTVPFMRAYTERMIQSCHKRGAHAIGGMAAFIPNRRDMAVTENALAKVREDKMRESSDGCDGTWVAHPDLVPVAKEVFDAVLGDRPHQKERLREEVDVQSFEILNPNVPNGHITEGGVRANVSVALQYLNAWLNGNGAAAINNLMEDVATAEISRSQLWQWCHHGALLDDGRPVTPALYAAIRDEELAALGGRDVERYGDAADLMDQLVLADEFIEFLTLIAYDLLD